MFTINTGVREIQLVAKAKNYCDLKQQLGCKNLKYALMKAYDEVDISILVKVIKAFAEPRLTNDAAAEQIIDECLANGILFEDIFTHVVNFVYDMGFMGAVDLKDGETIQEYIREPLNKLDFDSKVMKVIDSQIETAATEMISEAARKQVTPMKH